MFGSTAQARKWTLPALLAVLGISLLASLDLLPLLSPPSGDAPVVGAPDAPRVTPAFVDVTADAGVGFQHHALPVPLGAGAAVLDFNNDGHQDIYVVDSDGPNALYLNGGDGTFTDVAAKAGVADASGVGNGVCPADYDNDGYQDIFVTNYGPSTLFRNSADGTFADVSTVAGVEDTYSSYRSMGCAWGDYDQDGFVDLIIVRHLERWYRMLLLTRDFVDHVGSLVLYHNNGDGTFTDMTHLLGDASGPRLGKGDLYLGNVWGAGFQPRWIDYDNDGDVDLYTVNDFGADIQPNVLWRNDGPSSRGVWKFVDVSERSNADLRIHGMGLAVGDYNLDGYLDLFVTDIFDNVLLRNSGDGSTFVDTSSEAAVGREENGPLLVGWGAAFLDHDNDGDEDLYVVNGHVDDGSSGQKSSGQSNRLYSNLGDGTFRDISSESGAAVSGDGRSGVYLDYDNDGCLDLFVTNLGGAASLLRNACNTGNNWLIVDIVGTKSNRDGIGARLSLLAGDSAQIRDISSGSGSMGQDMLPAHFGLGDATTVDSLTIRWPSGTLQTVRNIPVNQRITVTEP